MRFPSWRVGGCSQAPLDVDSMRDKLSCCINIRCYSMTFPTITIQYNMHSYDKNTISNPKLKSSLGSWNAISFLITPCTFVPLGASEAGVPTSAWAWASPSRCLRRACPALYAGPTGLRRPWGSGAVPPAGATTPPGGTPSVRRSETPRSCSCARTVGPRGTRGRHASVTNYPRAGWSSCTALIGRPKAFNQGNIQNSFNTKIYTFIAHALNSSNMTYYLSIKNVQGYFDAIKNPLSLPEVPVFFILTLTMQV